MMHTLPPAAQEAIRDDLEGTHKYRPTISRHAQKTTLDPRAFP